VIPTPVQLAESLRLFADMMATPGCPTLHADVATSAYVMRMAEFVANNVSENDLLLRSFAGITDPEDAYTVFDMEPESIQYPMLQQAAREGWNVERALTALARMCRKEEAMFGRGWEKASSSPSDGVRLALRQTIQTVLHR